MLHTASLRLVFFVFFYVNSSEFSQPPHFTQLARYFFVKLLIFSLYLYYTLYFHFVKSFAQILQKYYDVIFSQKNRYDVIF